MGNMQEEPDPSFQAFDYMKKMLWNGDSILNGDLAITYNPSWWAPYFCKICPADVDQAPGKDYGAWNAQTQLGLHFPC